ncbi:hypothetical protein [Halalkalibacter urbisdiaboli]|uniref:YqgU-like beta propeller domain-containing protein n=1 Tax=Halalkalibacter urbisdiaboli TaxID=1960589 RepID=UPI000B43443B|nr:hypothetical protein [Halalkalibacter urbisdiaboli]
MMRLIYIALIIVLCTGCIHEKKNSHPSPGSQLDVHPKRDAPPTFLSEASIVPLSPEHSTAPEISEWFNERSVLYLYEKDEKSSLFIHDLFTGESTLFFKTDGWIINVTANHNHSIFAIQIVTSENKTKLIFTDKEGQTMMKVEGFGEEYSVIWSPFEEDKLIVVAYLPNWELEVLYVDIEERKLQQLEISESYVQWISENTVAYLKWDPLEPNFQAPLYTFNLNTEEEELWKEDTIAFVELSDERSFAVSVESAYDLYSVYTFFNLKDRTVLNMLEIPILNTYSDQWWIPFHAYGKKDDIFYYLRPKYSGDYFSYEDGYELMAFKIEANAESKLIELEEHVPLLLSPDEKYLLLGARYERILDLETKTIFSLYNN